ncbi:hypothetical protein [Salmonella phage AR2819]|nr:hypothetical protein [Salmonella phage AR2819]
MIYKVNIHVSPRCTSVPLSNTEVLTNFSIKSGLHLLKRQYINVPDAQLNIKLPKKVTTQKGFYYVLYSSYRVRPEI